MARPLDRITAETVVTYGLSHRDSLTLSSLAEPVLCVQRRLPRPDGGVVEPQEFPLPDLPAPAAELLPLLGTAAVAAATDKRALSVVELNTKGGMHMMWYEILIDGHHPGRRRAFTAGRCTAGKSGPTGCIGCGKCVADGVCILTGKQVPGTPGRRKKAVISPLTIRAEMFIINVSENSKKP